MLISLITLATLQLPTEITEASIPYTSEVQEELTTNQIEEISLSHSLARLEDMLRPPTLDEVSRGALLQKEHTGEAVTEVKKLFASLNIDTSDNDLFDDSLESAVGDFQEKYGLVAPDSHYRGKVGPSTLSALRSAAMNNYDPALGEQLARYARNHISGGRGSCYRYVARAIHATTSPFLKGYHAYMAAPHLARSPYFEEIEVDTEELVNLPAGAVVVWGKGKSRSGHISIADGRGNEISDHVSQQMLAHYGGASHRVFLPVSDS